MDTDVSSAAGTVTSASTRLDTHVGQEHRQEHRGLAVAGMAGSAAASWHRNGTGASIGGGGSSGGAATTAATSGVSSASSSASLSRKRLLAVVMVSTGFEDRLTRDAVRNTWMPTGEREALAGWVGSTGWMGGKHWLGGHGGRQLGRRWGTPHGG